MAIVVIAVAAFIIHRVRELRKEAARNRENTGTPVA